jgi:cytochrome c
MRLSRVLPVAATSAVIFPIGSAPAVGDAARGAIVFQQCAACHSTVAGEQMTGPSLAGIWEKKAGTVGNFHRYSDAMKRADLVWNGATLDKWLTNPEAVIPGTTMTFSGLRDRAAREDVIAYLKAVSDESVPTTARRSGMMSMQARRSDLKSAPPLAQVTAITHCGDTYAVRTADGKLNKVWEFNLRFKTDSSELGPRPGNPVIVGAGMQGDRASIVFAAPSEISGFVKESCE